MIKNPVMIAIILIMLPLANAYDLLNNNGLNYYISYLYDGDNLTCRIAKGEFR
jgi:hypothetical protein